MISLPAPPPELTWIGIIGGILGIPLTFLKLQDYWINRRRIEFHVISAIQYYSVWEEVHAQKNLESYTWPIPEDQKWGHIKPGDCRQAFVVLEFAIRNYYSRDVTVGRFKINDWMYSDHYTRVAYGPRRDYRVFDLYTKELTDLEVYKTIPPGGSYSIRVEILEETDGPEWVSNHVRYVIDLPESYTLEFQSDVQTDRRQEEILPRNKRVPYFSQVYRWSNLLGETKSYGWIGDPVPQGLQEPDWFVSTDLSLLERILGMFRSDKGR